MAPIMTPPTASAATASAHYASAIGGLNGAQPKAWSWFRLLSLSIGFLGIQVAWSLQMGQMGPLLERLGSDPILTGLIFAAGPVTGVLVQPIVGALSDKCGSKLGRRRPFLLAGAITTAVVLLLMPNSINLLMAALLLWVLDASINLTQGPYRALVPDVVPPKQQASAYALMSLTIGLGSVAAFWIAAQIDSIHTLFYMGAASILAAMLWTILRTPEQPIQALPADDRPAATQGLASFFKDTFQTIVAMPKDAKVLCLAHACTWFGLGCLFFFFSLYVPHHIFNATDPNSDLYRQGVQWASLCYAVLNGVCFAFSGFIGKLCNLTSKKAIHTIGLLCMAASLIGMYFLTSPEQVMMAMGLFGIGWATTLSVPFALLSEHIPAGREGVLMGAFNIFVAAPQMLTSLLVGPVVKAAGGEWSVALVIGGTAMLVSALVLQKVNEGTSQPTQVAAAA
jgi:maltose/moltooligosaccharide transporter